jgi:hypothetical protein
MFSSKMMDGMRTECGITKEPRWKADWRTVNNPATGLSSVASISQGIFYGENTFYSFKYGDPEIRKLFPELQRELVEYVFHPSRIKNIEQLDDM